MKVYHYHSKYKYYLGNSYADESELEPGIFLIPANSTTLPPPELQTKSQVQIFNGTSWNIVENQSGVYYSTITNREIFNEDPAKQPENSTKEKPPEVPYGHYLMWNNGWEIKEIPMPNLTPKEKLARFGLTVEELKTLLEL
jgi:hypothetical protein